MRSVAEVLGEQIVVPSHVLPRPPTHDSGEPHTDCVRLPAGLRDCHGLSTQTFRHGRCHLRCLALVAAHGRSVGTDCAVTLRPHATRRVIRVSLWLRSSPTDIVSTYVVKGREQR